MDFREALKAAVDKCIEDQRRSTDHAIHQAFLAGVGWHIDYSRERQKKLSNPPDPASVL